MKRRIENFKHHLRWALRDLKVANGKIGSVDFRNHYARSARNEIYSAFRELFRIK